VQPGTRSRGLVNICVRSGSSGVDRLKLTELPTIASVDARHTPEESAA
jgi:hypothetical protein